MFDILLLVCNQIPSIDYMHLIFVTSGCYNIMYYIHVLIMLITSCCIHDCIVRQTYKYFENVTILVESSHSLTASMCVWGSVSPMSNLSSSET